MLLNFYMLHCLSPSLFYTFLFFQKESMRQQANADPSSVKKCSAMWREIHWEKSGLSVPRPGDCFWKHRGLEKHKYSLKYNLSDVTEKKTLPVHSIYSQQTRLWIETTLRILTNTEKNAFRYCSFSLLNNSQNVNVLVKLEEFLNFWFILHAFLPFIYL